MTYVVGTVTMDVARDSGPQGTLHAIRLEDAYTGIAICGVEVYAWPDIDFPTGRPVMECQICQQAEALEDEDEQDEDPVPERIAIRRGHLGMPDELFDSIASHSDNTKQLMMRNWEAIGEDGRKEYLKYLSRAWTQRGLRKRADLAAEQLVDPGRGFQIPFSGGV